MTLILQKISKDSAKISLRSKKIKILRENSAAICKLKTNCRLTRKSATSNNRKRKNKEEGIS
jgi:hypothetical protein